MFLLDCWAPYEKNMKSMDTTLLYGFCFPLPLWEIQDKLCPWTRSSTDSCSFNNTVDESIRQKLNAWRLKWERNWNAHFESNIKSKSGLLILLDFYYLTDRINTIWHCVFPLLLLVGEAGSAVWEWPSTTNGSPKSLWLYEMQILRNVTFWGHSDCQDRSESKSKHKSRHQTFFLSSWWLHWCYVSKLWFI